MIRKAVEKDFEEIFNVHRLAFGQEDEAELVLNLVNDESAQPVLSLVAETDAGEICAHILFTKAYVEGALAYLLAPLAVHPDYHYKGHGQRLMKAGFKELAAMGVDLVFVLGDPAYYPRCGFQINAGSLGYPAPHPIPPEWRDAWMVRKLSDKDVTGPVRVADAIMPIEYWSD